MPLNSFACSLLALALTAVVGVAAAAGGLGAIKSKHSAKVTMDKFEATAKEKWLNVLPASTIPRVRWLPDR